MPSETVFPTDQPLRSAELNTVWDAVSVDLKSALGEATFELWFSQSRLVRVEGHRAVISAPGSMYAIWIEENFRDVLKFSLSKYLEKLDGFSFDFSQAEEKPVSQESFFPELDEKQGESDQPDPVASAPKKGKRKKKRRPLTEEEFLEKGRKAGLTEVHSFENFVVGENSELAVAAAHAVVEKPGSTYQPLFLHSGSGMGKTHLLHAIGWEFLRQRPHSKVLYVGAEKFANEYIDGIRNHSESAFRKKFREVDLLLIDDVQFLGGKSGMQREFFHTFNTLINNRNQIVLASDCLASEIPQLEERILSRMQWGLTVEIDPPSEMTSEAILRRKRDDWQVKVSDSAISQIVQCVSSNVRQLEGALIRTALVASMGEEELGHEKIDDLLADMVDMERAKPVGMEDVKLTVADFFNVDVTDLEGKRRTSEITKARQVAMYLCRELTDHSLKEVGASFAKDHASVVYASKTVKTKCEESESLRGSVELLRRRMTRGSIAADVARLREKRNQNRQFRSNRDEGLSSSSEGTTEGTFLG